MRTYSCPRCGDQVTPEDGHPCNPNVGMTPDQPAGETPETDALRSRWNFQWSLGISEFCELATKLERRLRESEARQITPADLDRLVDMRVTVEMAVAESELARLRAEADAGREELRLERLK